MAEKCISILIPLHAEYSILNIIYKYLFNYTFINIRGNMTLVLGSVISVLIPSPGEADHVYHKDRNNYGHLFYPT